MYNDIYEEAIHLFGFEHPFTVAIFRAAENNMSVKDLRQLLNRFKLLYRLQLNAA